MSDAAPAEKPLTLFSLTADEIEELLQLSSDPARNELASHTRALTTPEDKIRLLESDRRHLRTVFEAARFSHFAVEKLAADKDFEWTIQLKFSHDMPKVHHRYVLHFCYNPIPYFDRLDKLDTQIQSVRANPTLIPEEDEVKIEDLNKARRLEDMKSQEMREACGDIDVDAVVREVKYREGTVIVFEIPAFVVNVINDRRWNMGSYNVRLQNVS